MEDLPKKIFLDCTTLVKGSYGYNPYLAQDFPIVDLLTYLLNVEIRHPGEYVNLEEDLKQQLLDNLDLFVSDHGFDISKHRYRDWIQDAEVQTFINYLIHNLSVYINENPYLKQIKNGFYVSSMGSPMFWQDPRYEFILEAF